MLATCLATRLPSYLATHANTYHTLSNIIYRTIKGSLEVYTSALRIFGCHCTGCRCNGCRCDGCRCNWCRCQHQWRITSSKCPEQWMSRAVNDESSVFTISTSSFWGKSRTTALVSHLELSISEGCLARKLCFCSMSFRFHSLRDVSHEMHFQEIADARHAEFCNVCSTKLALEDGWGRSASRRFVTVSAVLRSFSDRPRSVTAALGVVLPSGSCQLVFQESFVFTSWTSVFEGSLAWKLPFSPFQLALFEGNLHESSVSHR